MQSTEYEPGQQQNLRWPQAAEAADAPVQMPGRDELMPLSPLYGYDFLCSLPYSSPSGSKAGSNAIDDFLLLDGGSFSELDPQLGLLRSRFCARAMLLMQYDAVNISGREAQLDPAELLAVLDELPGTPFVSANLLFRPDPLEQGDESSSPSKLLNERIEKFVRIRTADQDFLVTGLASREYAGRSTAGEEHVLLLDPLEALQAVLQQARPEDFVVVLQSDLSPGELAALNALPGIGMLQGAAGARQGADQLANAQTSGSPELASASAGEHCMLRMELRMSGDSPPELLGSHRLNPDSADSVAQQVLELLAEQRRLLQASLPGQS
ncbi:hypothetical protein KDL44_02425 [bacterium]|nr:hypothetical protein [bacterium]